MYRDERARVYRCQLCGAEATVVARRHGYGKVSWPLPDGWTGSAWRRGSCMCPRCSEAFARALGEVDGR